MKNRILNIVMIASISAITVSEIAYTHRTGYQEAERTAWDNEFRLLKREGLVNVEGFPTPLGKGVSLVSSQRWYNNNDGNVSSVEIYLEQAVPKVRRVRIRLWSPNLNILYGQCHVLEAEKDIHISIEHPSGQNWSDVPYIQINVE